MPPQNLGARIARLRTRRKLTQEELADRAHVHRVTLADIERGAAPQPRLETLERLARALRVPLVKLLAK